MVPGLLRHHHGRPGLIPGPHDRLGKVLHGLAQLRGRIRRPAQRSQAQRDQFQHQAGAGRLRGPASEGGLQLHWGSMVRRLVLPLRLGQRPRQHDDQGGLPRSGAHQRVVLGSVPHRAVLGLRLSAGVDGRRRDVDQHPYFGFGRSHPQRQRPELRRRDLRRVRPCPGVRRQSGSRSEPGKRHRRSERLRQPGRPAAVPLLDRPRDGRRRFRLGRPGDQRQRSSTTRRPTPVGRSTASSGRTAQSPRCSTTTTWPSTASTRATTKPWSLARTTSPSPTPISPISPPTGWNTSPMRTAS